MFQTKQQNGNMAVAMFIFYTMGKIDADTYLLKQFQVAELTRFFVRALLIAFLRVFFDNLGTWNEHTRFNIETGEAGF